MADKKISELTNITGANLQDTDEFVVVDTSANETKAITYGELKKFTGDLTVDTTTLHVDSTNNRVGVGTTSPLSQLHVYGTGQTTANVADAGNQGGFLRVSDAGSAGGSGGGILFTNVQADNAGSVGMAAIKGILTNGGGNTVGNLSFSTRASTTDTSLTERMRITNIGRVGIGTSNPTAALDVANASGTAVIEINAANTAASQLRFGDTDDNDVGLISYSHALNAFQVFTNAAERMRIDSSGNVGIGTSSPGSKLSIVGLPTSAAGLSAGDVYNDGGTLKIV